jgi:hypothetical protein
VGVFSTAIYEGIALGCRTCVVDLPGVEYMTRLVDAGYARKVSGADELAAALEDASEPRILHPDAIFKPVVGLPEP